MVPSLLGFIAILIGGSAAMMLIGALGTRIPPEAEALALLMLVLAVAVFLVSRVV